MSTKKIESKLKDLGAKNDVKALCNFVSSLSDEQICSLMTYKLCHLDAPVLLNYLYRGMTEKNDSTEMKRFKLTEKVLQELQSQKLQNRQVNAIVSRIVLEVEKFTPAHMVEFCEYCIHYIQQDDGEQMSWKDLVPKLLNVLDTQTSVNHSGVDMTGTEYKSEVIRTLLMVQWKPSFVTSLASMFTEVPMSKEQHLQVVNKICASFEQLGPQEIPPLVHQLLNLCKNQHGVVLFLRLQTYFCRLLYNRLPCTVDSEADTIEINTDNIGSASESEVQAVEATVLFHVHQSARFGHASVKDFIKFMRSMTNAPDLMLDPFLLTVLLSVSTISIYEEQILEILKCAIQRTTLEEEKKVESAWLRGVTPADCNVELVLTKLMANSLRERSSVVEGMVNLAFVLLGTTATKNKKNVAAKLWEYGIFVLVRLVKKHNETASTILQLLTDRIISGQAVTQYTDCLYQLSVSVPLVLNEYRSIIVNLLEMLIQLPGPVAENVVHAMLPMVRSFRSLRDVLIMVLRKALFSRHVGTRKMAVSGFVQLLKHLDVKGMAVLSSQSSQASCSQTQSQQHTLLTQIDMEMPGNSNNKAICLELLGVLRRCFMQQAEVRVRLYVGLHSGVVRNPEMNVYVQDMLINHFNQFYESDVDIMPPLKFNKTVVLRETYAELQEPLGHLVFVIQQVVTSIPTNSDSTRLINIMESLCKRMVNSSLEDFGLNETTDLFDDIPESQQQREVVGQILGVFEALMGYIISSWTKDTSVATAQKLNQVFKGYIRVAEFAKNSGKAGKKANNDADGTPRPKRMVGKKKAGGKGRTAVFRFPHTVLDYHVTYRMLSLLHLDSVAWCSEEAGNQIRGRREFSRYVLETLLKLLKSSRAEKSVFKTSSSHNYLFKFGSLLYKQCVVKLQEFCTFDVATAVLALDCFNELFALVCSRHKDILAQFLSEVGEVPLNDGLAKQLLAIVCLYEELLTAVLEDEDSEDEPIAKKIPLLLIHGLTQFALQISCSESISKVLTWVKTFAKDKIQPNVNLVKALVWLLFTMEVRCKGSSQLYDHIAMQLCSLVGIVDEGEEVGNHTSYSVLKTGYESVVLYLLCDTVKQMLVNVDWVLQRFRAEHMSMTHAVSDRLHSRRELLKSKEHDVVHQLSHCVQILNYVSSLALQPGPTCDAVLTLLSRQYVSLTLLTKYFILRSSKFNPAFTAARFEMVVKLAGKFLSPHVYNLISHIEANQEIKKKGKKKTLDSLTMKSKVLRETRFIPNLVFEMEQFEKFIIELSKKSKVDLMKYVKQATYRDFRIHMNRMQGAVSQDQTADDVPSCSVVNDRATQENGQADDNSVVREPPRKKPRKE